MMAGVLSAVVFATSFNCTPVYGAKTSKADANISSQTGYGFGCLPEDMSKISEENKIDTVEEYYDTVAEEQLEADGVVSEDVKEAIEDTDAVTADFPASVDNSQSEYFPAIGDQGSVGACTTFAQVYYQFTYEMNKQLGRTSKAKGNVFAPYSVYNLINFGGNNGTYADDCYDVLMKQGTLDFSKYSNETNYTTWTADASKWAEASNYRVASYQFITGNTGYSGHYVTSPKDSDLDTIKAALNNGEILTFYSISRGWKKGYTIKQNSSVPGNNAHVGEYIIPYVTSASGGHRVTIVGYDDDIWYDINGNGIVEESEKGAFKMANSWGTDADGHNDGFAWMSYDLLNNDTQVPNFNVKNRIRGISQIARMTVQPYDNDSDIKLYYTIKTAARYQARIKVKATKKSTGVSKTAYTTPFYTSAGESVNLGYDGTAGEQTGSMCMDLDNCIDGLNSDNFNDYDWEIEFKDTINDSYTSQIVSAEIVDSNNGTTYTLSGNYPISINGNSQKATITGSLNNFDVKNVDINSGYPFTYMNVELKGGVAPYTYSYTYTKKNNGTEYEAASNVSVTNKNFNVTLNTDAKAANNGTYPTAGFNGSGVNHIYMTITDSKGNTCTLDRDIVVEPYTIKSITADKVSPQNIDTEIRFTVTDAYRFNGYSSRMPLNYTWEYKNLSTGETGTIYGIPASNTGVWTPDKEGRYQITVSSSDGVNASSKSIEYVVKDNKTTVYYTNNSWSEAYIHFKTQNGSWTSVPGVKMEKSDVAGYTWKYVIDLSQDDSENVQVCFNNGNGSWDSRNAQNYILSSGVYSIQNGNINTVGLKVTSFTIDKPMTVGLADSNVSCTAEAGFGSGDYSYRFGTIFNGVKYYSSEKYYKDNTQTIFLSSVVNAQYPYHGVIGNHTLFAEVKDNVTGEIETKTIENFVVKPLAIKSFTSDAASNVIKVGTTVKLTAETEYEVGYRYNTYRFTAIKDGVRTEIRPGEYWNHYTKNWTPTETGNYTIEYYVYDGYEQSATATLNFTVVDDNTTTLYYNNDSWSQAYVHYKINGGEWTSVPGVRMEDTTEQSGYRWKFDFDLGDADGVTVCFNDGNGNWDSRNAQNYYIGTGVYGIKNGSVNSLGQ